MGECDLRRCGSFNGRVELRELRQRKESHEDMDQVFQVVLERE